MNDSFYGNMNRIAQVRSCFPTKFGIPRQSGLVEELRSSVVFEPQYRNPEALRGLEEFSHIWLIWQFSEAIRDGWTPTVRPPRLGGNVRKGVFATRSPFRPNPIGLSCVRLEGIEQHPSLGPVLHITGADMMDGTPVYDIKPYLPFVDSHPEAAGGFSDTNKSYRLEVVFPKQWLCMVPEKLQSALLSVLAQDPRPSYHSDPERVYGFPFAELEVKFQVAEGVLTVCGVDCVRYDK